MLASALMYALRLAKVSANCLAIRIANYSIFISFTSFPSFSFIPSTSFSVLFSFCSKMIVFKAYSTKNHCVFLSNTRFCSSLYFFSVCFEMDRFFDRCRALNMEPPSGLLCLIYHTERETPRETRKAIYRALHNKLIEERSFPRGVTGVFPPIIRDAICEEWRDRRAGR